MATSRRDELVARRRAAVRRAGLPRDLDGRSRGGDGRAEGSLYSLTGSKQELLVAVARDGATSFHAALDRVRTTRRRSSGSAPPCAGISRSSPAQVDAATVFTREWRFLDEPERAAFRAERRRYEERWHELLRDAADRGALRSDLDVEAAVLLVLSAANWAYTWLRPGADTDALADRFFAILARRRPGVRTAVRRRVPPRGRCS